MHVSCNSSRRCRQASGRRKDSVCLSFPKITRREWKSESEKEMDPNDKSGSGSAIHNPCGRFEIEGRVFTASDQKNVFFSVSHRIDSLSLFLFINCFPVIDNDRAEFICDLLYHSFQTATFLSSRAFLPKEKPSLTSQTRSSIFLSI